MTERERERHGRGAPTPLIDRWFGRLTLLALSVALLTFSFAGPKLGSVAPFGQFYLAYVGLVPYLLIVRRLRSQRAAFFWFWGTGIVFFLANMWWLVYVTAPGMAALMALQGFYWGMAAVLIRGLRLLDPYPRSAPAQIVGAAEHDLPQPSIWRVTMAVILVPAVWVGLEWVRGNYPLHGLPWLFLGHTQSPKLPLCQIADITGVYGISFWVVSVNVLVTLAIVHRSRLRRVLPATLVVIAMTVGIIGYGLYRLLEETTLPGPTVTVIQSNYPQSNSGEKGAEITEIIDYHLSATEKELARVGPGQSDLVIWSETVMPPLNSDARNALGSSRLGRLIEQTDQRIARLAAQHDVSVLTGGTFEANWQEQGEYIVPADRRNSAYFYTANGALSPKRYDKVHIVPFGEYLPGKDIVPPLYKLFVWLSPYPVEYFLQPGSESQLTVFELAPRGLNGGGTGVNWRFVTPICFEDIDPSLVAKMFRGPDGNKRADLIVNITNDGWFRGSEMPLHLQCAVFRSIENRVPTARSVNTGISAFIDSTGQVFDRIGVDQTGARTAALHLDGRYTFYTRFGDLFAQTCAGGIGLMALAGLVRWWGRRGERREAKALARAG